MAKTGGKSPGTQDDIIGEIYQRLQVASGVEQHIQDAEQQGDREVVEFLRDYQEAQGDLIERARNLLGARRARQTGLSDTREEARMKSDPKKAAPQKIVVDAEKLRERSAAGVPTNATVKSGGREQDDIVDEQSKESFPASDAPTKY